MTWDRRWLWALFAGGVALWGCHPPERRAEPLALPPAMQFLALVEVDPVAAAPLAREILRSPLTDDATRGRVVAAWTRAVAPLEALRDARLADAEALLAQGAVGAATEAVNEASELESAVGLVGTPRSASELAREVEWARSAAERTAREAGERARGAWRVQDWVTASAAAAEARQLRNRAGLTADVHLAVIEGLSRRAVPEPASAPDPEPTALAAERGRNDRPASRQTVRRKTPEAPSRPTPALAADPLADARHAWRNGDVPAAEGALARARAEGAGGGAVDALEQEVDARRAVLVAQALAAAEAAYAREDLEAARAFWERVIELSPDNPRAAEGLSLYRRFLALQGR
jgi:tetratricopeptide (TPR) repeat protein